MARGKREKGRVRKTLAIVQGHPASEPPFCALGVLVGGKITSVKVKTSDNLILSRPFSSNRRETQAPPVCTNAPSSTWELVMQRSRSAQGPLCRGRDACGPEAVMSPSYQCCPEFGHRVVRSSEPSCGGSEDFSVAVLSSCWPWDLQV